MRYSDFFVFFPNASLEARVRTTARQPTWNELTNGSNLGTAIAISGAALAPNRGSDTVRPPGLRDDITQCPYWILVAQSAICERVLGRAATEGAAVDRCRPPLLYLRNARQASRTPALRERNPMGDTSRIWDSTVCSGVDANSSSVCDAEEDPDMTFNGLAKVIR